MPRFLALVLLPHPSSFLLPPSLSSPPYPSFLVLPRPSSSFLILPHPSSSFLILPHPSSSSPDLICQLLIVVGLAGLYLPALDRSEPRRISSASSWSQWGSSPDFNRRGSERCGPYRTSTGEGLRCGPGWTSAGEDRSAVGPLRASTSEGRSAVGLAGLPPVTFGALWASPDFNRRDLARRGPRRTSTGPHRPETKPYRMPKRMPDRMLDRMPEDMPDRMSEELPDRMLEDLSDRMPDRYTRWNIRRFAR